MVLSKAVLSLGFARILAAAALKLVRDGERRSSRLPVPSHASVAQATALIVSGAYLSAGSCCQLILLAEVERSTSFSLNNPQDAHYSG